MRTDMQERPSLLGRMAIRIFESGFGTRAASAVIALLLLGSSALATGSRRTNQIPPPASSRNKLRSELVRARDEAVKAANEYKATLGELRSVYQIEVARAEAQVKKYEELI